MIRKANTSFDVVLNSANSEQGLAKIVSSMEETKQSMFNILYSLNEKIRLRERGLHQVEKLEQETTSLVKSKNILAKLCDSLLKRNFDMIHSQEICTDRMKSDCKTQHDDHTHKI